MIFATVIPVVLVFPLEFWLLSPQLFDELLFPLLLELPPPPPVLYSHSQGYFPQKRQFSVLHSQGDLRQKGQGQVHSLFSQIGHIQMQFSGSFPQSSQISPTIVLQTHV